MDSYLQYSRKRTDCGRCKNSLRIPNRQRRGLSLLEVIVSLSILAMSSALLWQITSQATNNARGAQRLTRAQILCESKLAEILAGAIQVEPIDWTLDTSGSVPGEWYYRIQTSTEDRENMIAIRLSVSDNPQNQFGNPEVFFVVRYVIDPQLGMDTPVDPSLTDATSTSSTTGASSSSGTSSSGAGGGF